MVAFSNNYVVGKGRLLFQPFAPGSRGPLAGVGFKYFGNTPSLEVTRSATGLDHMDSDAGIKQIDDSIDIETKLVGKFATDNVSGNNLALWFAGSVYSTPQVAGAALGETFTGAMPDSYYQIGATVSDPSGIRKVSGFTAHTGAAGSPVPLVEGTDFTFDPASGMLYLVPGGAIDAATDVVVSYTLVSTLAEVVIEQGIAQFGALKFLANNPKGSNRDYFWPYVKISPDGTYALKGDTWQQMGFAFEALKKDDLTHRQYIDLKAA